MTIDVRGVAPLLQVYDMPTSVRFYRDLLGFTVVNTSPPLGGQDRYHWCLLSLGSAEMMLNTAYEYDHERPPTPDRKRVESHDDTCLYFGCPNIDAAYQELQAKGVAVEEPKVAPYGMKQMYLHDPDGYTLCFQWPAST